MLLRALVTVALAVLLAAPRAVAQPRGCAATLASWAARCASRHAVTVHTVACPRDDLTVLSVQVPDGPPLRVELTRATRGGFRRVGPYALSPIGEFPDWSAAPPALRDGFDRVVACAAELDAPHLRDDSRASLDHLVASRGGAPWLLALAALVAWLAHRRDLRAVSRREVVAGLGVAAVTWALRDALHPAAYFHQNGQGPLWIDQLVGPTALPYGPGFTELFRLPARISRAAPEVGVFAAQSALAATQPLAAWGIARALGAPPWVAGALACSVVTDPALGRLARSEGYFGVGASLALLAAWSLARAPGLASCVAAGLLLAQAVRVHPALWVPAAMVPLVVALRPVDARARVVDTLRACAITGAVIAATSLTSLRAVLDGELAARWISAHAAGPSHALPLLAAALAAALSVALARRAPAATPAAALALTAVTFAATDNYTRSGSPAWIVAAYARTFAPLVIAGVASLGALVAARTGHARRVGLALAAAWLGLVVARRTAWTTLPTDALELQHAWRWRARLPRGARVVYVSRVGPYVLSLPLHPADREAPRGVALDLDEPNGSIAPPPAGAYYYRGSICETAVAAARCDALERSMRLAPVARYTLAPVPSMAHLPYRGRAVSVTLSRVTE